MQTGRTMSYEVLLGLKFSRVQKSRKGFNDFFNGSFGDQEAY